MEGSFDKLEAKPLDLMDLYNLGELKVSGSKSYYNDKYLPVEAINHMSSTANKFGGIKNPN
jgi:hypothetical protein